MLSGKQFIINSLHVVTGASVLVTSLVLTLRAHRARFARVGQPDPSMDDAGYVGRPSAFAKATADRRSSKSEGRSDRPSLAGDHA